MRTARTSLAVVGGRVFVLAQTGATMQDLFSVDIATHAVGKQVALDFNAGDNTLNELMTDGTGLYTFDAGTDTLFELDQATLTAKRTLQLATIPNRESTTGSPFIAAGALWIGHRCDGATALRRVDLAAWTISDLPITGDRAGDAINGRFAYLAP
jgi:hypothetical protein